MSETTTTTTKTETIAGGTGTTQAMELPAVVPVVFTNPMSAESRAKIPPPKHGGWRGVVRSFLTDDLSGHFSAMRLCFFALLGLFGVCVFVEVMISVVILLYPYLNPTTITEASGKVVTITPGVAHLPNVVFASVAAVMAAIAAQAGFTKYAAWSKSAGAAGLVTAIGGAIIPAPAQLPTVIESKRDIDEGIDPAP